MNNLFVCHTQYNLLLAVGLALKDFNMDKNDLILFEDFNMNEKLKYELKRIFKKSIFINHMPVILSSAKEKMKRICQDINKLNRWINGQYDRLFIIDDMCIQEMFIMKKVVSFSKNVEIAWLEDGSSAYFSNGVISGGMGKGVINRFIREIFFTVRFGLYGYYDLADCMGGHKRITHAYLTFPKSVRKELAEKETKLISQECVESGMKILYPGEVFNADKNSIFLALDKLDRYGENLEIVQKLIMQIVDKCKQEKKTLYYKLHPREDKNIPCLMECVELDRNVAAESYLIHCNHRDLTVVGIMSTTLQTAHKLGYETISYVQFMKNSNSDIIYFYDDIGIKCPERII